MKYPTDIEAANAEWGANCGPSALAAILNKQVQDVRPFLTTFDKKRYMNPTDMKAALTAAGVKFTVGPKEWPAYGLVFVQWGGFENKPVIVQYQHTHWIAVANYGAGPAKRVFEVNAPHLVGQVEWTLIMPPHMGEHEKGCNGKFSIRSTILIDGVQP